MKVESELSAIVQKIGRKIKKIVCISQDAGSLCELYLKAPNNDGIKNHT